MTEKVKSDPLIFKGFFSNLVNDHVPSDTDSEKKPGSLPGKVKKRDGSLFDS